MITFEQANARIADMSDNSVRELSIARLTGEDQAPVGSGYFDEPGEDLVIQLLRCSNLSRSVGNAVVEACLEVYGRVFSWLHSTKDFRTPGDIPPTLERVCNVSDATGHPKLEGSAQALLSFACKALQFPSGLLWHVVRGALSYVRPGDASQVSLWTQVLHQPDVCAYGFMALLTIDPYSNRIERALEELFLHQIRDAWPVDTPFLMRRAARQRGSKGVIENVLTELQEHMSFPGTRSDDWVAITQELTRRPWSRSWVPSSAVHSAVRNWYRITDSALDLLKSKTTKRVTEGQRFEPQQDSGIAFPYPDRITRQLTRRIWSGLEIRSSAARSTVFGLDLPEEQDEYLKDVYIHVKESLRSRGEQQVDIRVLYPQEDFETRETVNRWISGLAGKLVSSIDYSGGEARPLVNDVA